MLIYINFGKKKRDRETRSLFLTCYKQKGRVASDNPAFLFITNMLMPDEFSAVLPIVLIMSIHQIKQP
jgi:hypothetical protein